MIWFFEAQGRVVGVQIQRIPSAGSGMEGPHGYLKYWTITIEYID